MDGERDIEPLLSCNCAEHRALAKLPADERDVVTRLPYKREASLPPGPTRLTREEVKENQRHRLVTAMAESCRRFGLPHTSVQDVVELSGVGRRAFYELYADLHDCFEDAVRVAREA
jgi:hypothetical protein